MAGNVGQYAQYMQQILAYTQQAGQIAMQSALFTGAMSAQKAQIEAQGVQAQLQMDQMATAANIQSDLANLSMRNTMGLALKAQEMSLFIAQYREKTLAMFLQIQESRDANVWGRMKNTAQGFKY